MGNDRPYRFGDLLRALVASVEECSPVDSVVPWHCPDVTANCAAEDAEGSVIVAQWDSTLLETDKTRA